MKIFTQGGPGLDLVAATAGCCHSLVLGMDFCLHGIAPYIDVATRSLAGHHTWLLESAAQPSRRIHANLAEHGPEKK